MITRLRRQNSTNASAAAVAVSGMGAVNSRHIPPSATPPKSVAAKSVRSDKSSAAIAKSTAVVQAAKSRTLNADGSKTGVARSKSTGDRPEKAAANTMRRKSSATIDAPSRLRGVVARAGDDSKNKTVTNRLSDQNGKHRQPEKSTEKPPVSASRNGAASNRSARNGAGKNGTVKNDTAKNGTVKNGTVELGTAAHGPGKNGDDRRAPVARPRSPSRQMTAADDSSADAMHGEFFEPGWLRVQWSISHATRLRAASQLGGGWVPAQVVLRVLDVSRGDVSTTASRVLAEIPLPADAKLWFVPVSRSVQLVRVHIAFVKDAGRFVSVLQSPVIKSVRVPVEELTAAADGDSAMSMSVSKSRRRSRRRAALNPQFGPIDLGPTVAQMAASTLSQLDLAAELRLIGRAQPRSRITFDDQQILVDATGTFSATLSQPEGRQVVGLTIASPDGRRKQTVVFSLEKNTRVLEPDIHDHDTSDDA